MNVLERCPLILPAGKGTGRGWLLQGKHTGVDSCAITVSNLQISLEHECIRFLSKQHCRCFREESLASGRTPLNSTSRTQQHFSWLSAGCDNCRTVFSTCAAVSVLYLNFDKIREFKYHGRTTWRLTVKRYGCVSSIVFARSDGLLKKAPFCVFPHSSHPGITVVSWRLTQRKHLCSIMQHYKCIVHIMHFLERIRSFVHWKVGLLWLLEEN